MVPTKAEACEEHDQAANVVTGLKETPFRVSTDTRRIDGVRRLFMIAHDRGEKGPEGHTDRKMVSSHCAGLCMCICVCVCVCVCLCVRCT